MTRQKGQTLLIILLVMAVGLTIALAVVSRSVTDIRISQQEEESAKAFSVAEAGIEEALRLGAAEDVTIETTYGLVTAHVTSNSQGGGKEYIFPKAIEAGEIQTVWLVNHNSQGEPDPNVAGGYSGNLVNFYWGNEGEESDELTTPALEVSVIYQDGTFKIKRGAFDPYNGMDGDRNDNGFEEAESNGAYSLGGKKFSFRKLGFPLPAGTLYALRLKLLYSNKVQNLGIADSDGIHNFPPQGNCFESTATMPDSGITRKVQQCKFYKAPPGIFDYVLYSEGDLIHQ